MNKPIKRYYITILILFIIAFVNTFSSSKPIISLNSLLVIFIIVLIISLLVTFLIKYIDNSKKSWEDDFAGGKDIIFYTSKKQYYVFALILLFVCILPFLGIKSDLVLISLPFGIISVVFIIFLLLFPSITLKINKNYLIYSRNYFFKKISINIKWQDITDIIFNPKPGDITNNFKSGEFYIKTANQLLGPIDLSNIKIINYYTLISQGDSLLKILEKLSGHTYRFSKQEDFSPIFSSKKNIIYIIIVILVSILLYYFFKYLFI